MTRTSSIFPMLVLAASPSACARSHRLVPPDSTTDEPAREAEDAAVPSTSDGRVDAPVERDLAWVFSRADEQLAIIGVRLLDGELVSTRRDIPYAATDLESARAYGLDVVLFDFANGRTSVEAFGTSWAAVEAADAEHRIEVRTSDAGDLVWTAVHRSGKPGLVRGQAARVRRVQAGDSAEEGAAVVPFYRYEAASESPDEAPRFSRFVGDRMLFVQHQRLYVAHSDPAASAIASDPRLLVSNAAYVPAAFATSLVVGDPDGKQVWIDYDGAVLTPEGFRPDIAVRGDHQLVDRGIWLLRDRQVDFLLTLPEAVSLDQVVATVPATANQPARVLTADARPSLSLLSEQQALATYEPPPVDCQDKTLRPPIHPGAFTCRTAAPRVGGQRVRRSLTHRHAQRRDDHPRSDGPRAAVVRQAPRGHARRHEQPRRRNPLIAEPAVMPIA